MHYRLQLTMPIVGFASRAGRVGDANVPYVSQEFLSSDDGILLVHRLEEMSKVFLDLAPETPSLSQIDRLLIVVGQNLQADIS